MKHPLTLKLENYLNQNNISYKEVNHTAAATCQESAGARGEELKIGGKTVLFKSKFGFSLFVISAAKEIDSTMVRKILRSPKLRFATTEEFQRITGTKIGALPPFGVPIFELSIYLDQSIKENTKIAFNAGVLTKSFILQMNDYLKLVPNEFYDFSK
jgi:Ala-tRNA(Pro) deacylase